MKRSSSGAPAGRHRDSIVLGEFDRAPRRIAVLSRAYAAGSATPHHRHGRAQLLHAVSGIMRVDTDVSTWLVPPARALWLPAGLAHTVTMRGRVGMRTLYVDAAATAGLPAQPMLIEVGNLLRELILALLEEPADYDEGGRGGEIAALILSELARMQPSGPALRLPSDARARKAALALIAEPACEDDLAVFAEKAGASPRTLARLFRGETGLSFAEWRARLRATEGLALHKTGLPIAEAALKVGYRSASAFTAMVRRVFGKAPRDL